MNASPGISRLSFLAQLRLFLLGLLGAPAAASAAETAAPGAPTPSGGPLYTQDFAAFQNKTLNQKVQELADREEIRELIARYAHRVAHGVSVADLFTDDGVFLVRLPGQPLQETRGREALNKRYGALTTNTVHPLPMIHNYLLAISGNEATGLCSNEVTAIENGQSTARSGYYDDRFRRENGRWKFVVRDVTFVH